MGLAHPLEAPNVITRQTRNHGIIVSLMNPTTVARVCQARAPVALAEFALELSRRRWQQEKLATVFTLDCPFDPLTPIDLFLHEPFDFALAYASRALFPVGNATVPVVGLATLIDMKRAAGRLRDLADIAELEQVARSRRDPNRKP
jgi:hypothetical protein